MKTVIGIDVGRSATKVICISGGKRHSVSFQSAASPAIALSTESAMAMAESETVLVRSRPFFTGETAIIQTGDDMLAGLSDDWANSDKHSALILGSINRLKALGVVTEGSIVVVGLPARLFASQKNLYGTNVSSLLAGYTVKVVPQPMGPFFSLYFDTEGGNDASLDDKSLAFIEVGQYTTDYALIDHGHVVERTFGSSSGMSEAASELQRLVQDRHRISISLVEATNLFIKPELMHFGKCLNVSEEVRLSVSPLAHQIAEKAQQLFGDRLRHMHGIHLAGGGAPLVHGELVKIWTSTMGTPADGFVTLAEHARFAVAEGFARFGLSFASR